MNLVSIEHKKALLNLILTRLENDPSPMFYLTFISKEEQSFLLECLEHTQSLEQEVVLEKQRLKVGLKVRIDIFDREQAIEDLKPLMVYYNL
jgi:hypothetical protein